MLNERLYRPLAQLLVDPLARQNVNPAHVVLFHTALGVYAAWLIRRGGPWWRSRLTPALLLQVKTVLDNLDGQLARATGQTTETGRYLDTEMDLVVDLALNVAIAGRAGLPLTVLQSLILTTDFLWEQGHRTARDEVFRESAAQAGDDPRVLAALKAVYAAYFSPQERVLGGWFETRLNAVAGGSPTSEERRAYTPLPITTVAANLGLTTQLALLGACLLADRPQFYTRSLPFQALLLLGVQRWREGQVNRETVSRT
ncbi:CDP-alcohol phosphatidyltransferase family protein [Deinococcus sp. SM5_A1]|uniref:CDP-alcohol phosphatidyltransferase family protein n=1 Tax=Deinococcus sp. SM5_A1 TaxID=3379094 RepID=UPI00385CD26F